MQIDKYFTNNINPLDLVEWERGHSIKIKASDGSDHFHLEDAEFPASWSDQTNKIVASKYFKTVVGEDSARDLIDRVATFITKYGKKFGYFDKKEAKTFYNELAHILINQHAAFNSPVWFNFGLHEKYGMTGDPVGNWAWDKDAGAVVLCEDAFSRPQGSACFIVQEYDDLMKIAEGTQREMRLFKFGSGVGANFSVWRSNVETLSTGGKSSGIMSFLSIRDKAAGATKSGGTTRRAAKMCLLNADHPQIEDFIHWKRREERKAKVLEKYSDEWKLPVIDDTLQIGDMDGEAVRSVDGQNSNNSVRASDKFLEACVNDEMWELKEVTTGKVVKQLRAKDLLRHIAEAAWETGDPGFQFDDTINLWNPVLSYDRFYATNPCSEYSFLNDTACNLASINLLKFYDPVTKKFDWEAFTHTVEIMIIAMDIIVDAASYPTEEIARNSHKFRPLGLGYSNLGSLLMSYGVPYDSDEGRAIAGIVTAVMHAKAADTSKTLAKELGNFEGLTGCEEDMYRVMDMHSDAISGLYEDSLDLGLNENWINGAIKAEELMASAMELEEGLITSIHCRNGQLTNLAPTGTISFLMGCDSFGIEPLFSIIAYKTLAMSGEVLKIVSDVALTLLGSNEKAREYVLKHGTAKDCPYLTEYEQRVFANASEIPYKAHIRMMAAVQPFLSGAISKTVNCPHETTVEEIMDMYMMAWKLRIKSLAIYRDGCKSAQAISTREGNKKYGGSNSSNLEKTLQWGDRKAPSYDTLAFRHKFKIGMGHKGYLHIGLYDDGSPAEIFIKIAPYGGHIGGFLDAWATAVSKGIQRGWPLSDIVDTFQYWKFDPAGLTGNPDLGFASSVVDYVARFLKHFTEHNGNIVKDKIRNFAEALGHQVISEDGEEVVVISAPETKKELVTSDIEYGAPWNCPSCGHLNYGNCKPCDNCGYDPGCSGGRMG